ncbi:retinal short-chain dehydrogenase reductase [Fusarium mundagurra]|uniref:Retinal short-chain dehydrogenase reductase n=1 Tax=Fusarium mundagurra TaxID=1567541 RepID=A0A8H6DFG9_9HYPO|nr:retinal short-chain dehydrogenase reductase [Fusarium mundagurra]
MDEVVGRWPDVVRSSIIGTTIGTRSGIFHLTHVIDTHLKRNIALALTVCPVAVPNYPDIACTTCMLDHAGKMEREPYRESEGGDPADRYVINLNAMANLVLNHIVVLSASSVVLYYSPESYLRKLFDVNLLAPYLLTKQFIPSMIKRDHGHIVNIAS